MILFAIIFKILIAALLTCSLLAAICGIYTCSRNPQKFLEQANNCDKSISNRMVAVLFFVGMTILWGGGIYAALCWMPNTWMSDDDITFREYLSMIFGFYLGIASPEWLEGIAWRLYRLELIEAETRKDKQSIK